MQTGLYGTSPRTKASILGAIANTKSRLVARNTVEFTRPNGNRVLRFHDTDIAEWSGDTLVLNSGGFRTVTTKARINEILPAGIRLDQDRGNWWLRQDGERVAFYDGIAIRDGRIPAATRKGERELARIKKQTEAINKFVRPLLDPARPLPVPHSGDCWYCAMRDSSGRTWGEHGNDADHLRQHIKEGYLHGSLLVNALRHAGLSDTGIGYWLRDASPSGRRLLVGRVRRYLKAKLGLVPR